MRDTSHRTNPEQVSFIYRRFRAALDLRGLSIEALARKAQVSSRHLWFILTGQRRASSAVLQALREQLGEPGFRFAIGQVDVLTDEGGSHAA